MIPVPLKGSNLQQREVNLLTFLIMLANSNVMAIAKRQSNPLHENCQYLKYAVRR